jgi:hypothetical protein
MKTFYFYYIIFNIFVFEINEQNNFSRINGPGEAMKCSEWKNPGIIYSQLVFIEFYYMSGCA